MLIVTGAISNVTDRALPIPSLLGTLLDEESREVFEWRFNPPSTELGAGKTVEFATRVVNPPSNALIVEVRFADEG